VTRWHPFRGWLHGWLDRLAKRVKPSPAPRRYRAKGGVNGARLRRELRKEVAGKVNSE
jgi:hypothetical protein